MAGAEHAENTLRGETLEISESLSPQSHGDFFVPGLADRARRMSRGLRAGLRSSLTTWV